MIVIPAGSFMMGSPRSEPGRYAGEGPQHQVAIAKAFAVSKFALTFADWDACATNGGCNKYAPNDEGWGRAQQPVINVSWDDAQQYVTWLSGVTGKTYRLLSEAEYEYAARAGTTTAYPWGDDIKLDTTAMANCDGCGSKWGRMRTAPVGSFAPNQFGLHDMVGNVYAWTADCAHDNYNGALADGSAWLETSGGNCKDREIRGGSYVNAPGNLRSASRVAYTSTFRDVAIGLRIARTLP
jgi:formylglycine-generating enzyme required for sulfatase activity